MLSLEYKGVPRAALPKMAEQLKAFGAQVTFHDETHGELKHPSGVIEFEHRNDVLYLRVTQNAGHFPRLMLIGGMRQLVQETVEAMA